MKLLKFMFTLMLIFLFGVFSQLTAQNDEFKDNVKDLISEIKNYEIGNDRTSLSNFNDLMVNSLSDEIKLNFLEEQISKALLSEITYDASDFLCRQLSIFGTENSVDVLSILLNDQKTTNIARYALEKINSEKVDEKFLSSLKTANNEIKRGIVNSLGERETTAALEEIVGFLKSSDIELAKVSANAMGEIGGEKAAELILKSLKNKEISDEIKTDLFNAYLVTGNKFMSNGKDRLANQVFKNVMQLSDESYHQYAALRGVIFSDKTNSANIITEYLQKDDDGLVEVAASQIKLLNTKNDYKIISDQFNTFKPKSQELLLYKIGELKLSYFLPVVRESLNSEHKSVKIAALNSLSAIGESYDINLLLPIIVESESDISASARNTLYSIKGSSVDSEIVKLIEPSIVEYQIELVNAIGERRIESALPVLLEAARNNNIHLRLASYNSLSIISSPDQISELMKVFNAIENKSELKRAETMLAKVALKNNNKNERAYHFIKSLEKEDDVDKQMSLLRILGSTGDENAYEIISEYLTSENEDKKKTAIQSLYNWPNLDPIDDLMTIVKTDENETIKIIALRGYINLLKSHYLEADEKITEYYSLALEYSGVSEKRLVLSGLSVLGSIEAAEIASELLKNPEVKPEAELALLEILNMSRWSAPNASYDKLLLILEHPSSEDIEIETKKILKKIVRE